MGLGVFIHHIGTALLLAATALLIVASISAPVVEDISMLKVDLHDSTVGSEVTFGTFGWCVSDWHNTGHHHCSDRHIGYNPASEFDSIASTDFSDAREDTTKALTNVMVLHPVGAGICFLAFLICLGTGIIGSFIASMLSVLAFIVTAVAVICDFVCWSLIKHSINDSDTNGDATAKYGVAIWLVLAAAVCAFFAAILVFVTCCAGRIRDKRHQRTRSVKGWNDDVPNGRQVLLS